MFSIVFNFCYYSTLILVPIIVFVFFTKDENFHSKGGFLFFIKYIFGRRAIRNFRRKLKNDIDSLDRVEKPKKIYENESDRISFISTDQNGNQLNLKLTLKANHLIETYLYVKLKEEFYVLPDDDTVKSTKRHKTYSSCISKYDWNCNNGLKVEILEPFKRYRILFNGFLRKTSSIIIDAGDKKIIRHFKFNFIWNCCSKPNISWLDDDLNLLTSCLAQTKWRNGQWLELLGDEKGHNQFGVLKGKISINSQKETELNMTSIQKRYNGIEETQTLKKYITIFAATENGIMIHVGVKYLIDGCQQIKFGHVLTGLGRVFPIEKSDLNINFRIDRIVSGSAIFHIKANKKIYKMVVSIDKNSVIELENDDLNNGYTNSIISAECNINSNKGMALMNIWQSFKGNGIEKPIPILLKDSNNAVDIIPQIYVTNLESEEAKILKLTGGKGNSLALMKSLNSKKIKIPDGFIVTTEAFRQMKNTNLKLKKSIQILDDALKQNGNVINNNNNLKKICQEIVAIFDSSDSMPQSVAQAVKDELIKLKKKHDNDSCISFLSWAVRSSALGEDSEDHSSAGQNATFLGCQTDEQVLSNISKCWGSLFSHQSVVYRRQHRHQSEDDSEMAVVVQKMIPADSAGVLFTCDPSNDNPTRMVITSNFGLGETVVSGEIEPDTIFLSKSYQGSVKFHSSILGTKSHFLLMNKYEKFTVSGEKSKELSLSKEQSVKLGEVGVLLEKSFGNPRDIEWAFFENTLYILQCRPVTGLNRWTDYELIHEFDSPHISNDMFYTRANIGEVLPFPLTALTQSTVLRYLERGYQHRMFGKYEPYLSLTFGYSHHFAMIELIAGLYAKPRKQIEVASKIVDLSVFGHPVLNDEINKKAIARYGLFGDFAKYKEILLLIKYIWQSPTILKKMIKDVENYNINLKKEDSVQKMYEKIEKALPKFTDFSHSHIVISMISVVYQTFVMLTLMEGKQDITLEHFKDLSVILSSCEDVISAEIPKKLEEMSNVLKEQGLAEHFSTISQSKGMEWLEKNSMRTFELLQKFLTIHGHRLYGEMELSKNTWAMDPSQVIKMIQINCKKIKAPEKKTHSLKDIVNELQSPTKYITKKILRILLNKQRVAVANRETSKSTLVKAVDKVRSAYVILAEKMVVEGFLPNKTLIFHLTQHEIQQIIRNNENSFQLITKATKRQKLYPTLFKLKFPEIMFGMPIPENDENKLENSSNESGTVCIKGTPVCLGEVTARACVIVSLDEVQTIKEGDILITRSTDIGWSPYFPILSGIVTELGGLVSHGAVVAREYGLPCLIGVKGVTNMFRTGDIVQISGQKGTLTKI